MSRFMKRLTGVLVVIAIVAVSLSATAAIRIGLLLPLNGPAAEFGASARDGAELAITEWKERGGVLGHMIEVIKVDTSCDPQIASTAVEKLIDYGANFIIGGLCPIPSVAASEVANSSGALMVSLDCSLPAVTVASDGINKPYVFRIGFRDDYQAGADAMFAIRKLGANRAAILYEIEDLRAQVMASSFGAVFAELGGEVVMSEGYYYSQSDFSVLLMNVMESNADLIFCPGHPVDINKIGVQAKSLGITVPIVGVGSWQTGGLDHEALHGSYFSAQYSSYDLRRPMVAAFFAAFRNEYQYEADVWAVLAYDATDALLKAIRATETDDPKAVKDVLARQEFEGVSGFVRFDEHGDPIKLPNIHSIDRDRGIMFPPALPQPPTCERMTLSECAVIFIEQCLAGVSIDLAFDSPESLDRFRTDYLAQVSEFLSEANGSIDNVVGELDQLITHIVEHSTSNTKLGAIDALWTLRYCLNTYPWDSETDVYVYPDESRMLFHCIMACAMWEFIPGFDWPVY